MESGACGSQQLCYCSSRLTVSFSFFHYSDKERISKFPAYNISQRMKVATHIIFLLKLSLSTWSTAASPQNTSRFPGVDRPIALVSNAANDTYTRRLLRPSALMPLVVNDCTVVQGDWNVRRRCGYWNITAILRRLSRRSNSLSYLLGLRSCRRARLFSDNPHTRPRRIQTEDSFVILTFGLAPFSFSPSHTTFLFLPILPEHSLRSHAHLLLTR